jgi:hypothetical protein
MSDTTLYKPMDTLNEEQVFWQNVTDAGFNRGNLIDLIYNKVIRGDTDLVIPEDLHINSDNITPSRANAILIRLSLSEKVSLLQEIKRERELILRKLENLNSEG